MIKAKHHIIIYPFFQWLTRLMIKRNFNSFIIKGELNDTGFPVIVIANHISWWDGFWVMQLNLSLIKRKFYFMMLEAQLKKHWYFQFTGGFSVKRKTRGIIESLNYCIELLRHNGNMVLLFPQGQIYSMYCDTIKFENGIERIIEGVAPETQILFVANMIDYFSNAKPNLFIHLKSANAREFKQSNIEYEYNMFYAHVLNIQKMKTS